LDRALLGLAVVNAIKKHTVRDISGLAVAKVKTCPPISTRAFDRISVIVVFCDFVVPGHLTRQIFH
jgi:hypothetical protein